MTSKLLFRILLFGALVSADPSRASEPPVTWFSDAAPDRNAAHRQRHAHGGPVEMGRGGVVSKRLWLRHGVDPQTSEYAHGPGAIEGVWVLAPDGEVQPARFRPEDHGSLAFPMPQEGFYNLFMTHRHMDGGVQRVSVTKAEVLSHNCRNGHDHTKTAMVPGLWNDAPIEIIRERLDGETFHTLVGSGDRVAFRVLFRGQPAAGAKVRMVTQEGWSKEQTADAEGRVIYEMIRDYYPPWNEFRRRHRENYLITAEYAVNEVGQHEGQPYEHSLYRATLTGNYHPSPRDYASYGYGLLVGMAGLTVAGGGAYWHRRRRTRPYREVRISE